MDTPSLEVLKVRLDGALSNLMQWKMSLPTTEGLVYMIFKDCLQAKPFYDYVFTVGISSFEREKDPIFIVTI